MDGGKRVRIKLMLNVYSVRVCSVRTTTTKNGFDTKMSQVGTYGVRTVGMGFLCGRCKKWQSLVCCGR
jgi:hypothetical protein